MAQITKTQVNNVITKTFGAGTTFQTLKDRANGSKTLMNEFLSQIQNTLSEIVMVDFIKVKVPFLQYFIKAGRPIGDIKRLRQVMLAEVGDYSSYLDVNKHVKPQVKEQDFITVFKDRVQLSISAEIMAGAMLNTGGLASFISDYMKSMERSMTILWLNRYLKIFENHPIVYKVENSSEVAKDIKGVELAKELWKVITRMGMVSNKFNQEGIPSMTTPSEMVIIINSNHKVAIEFDSVGGVYNFGNISNSAKIGGIYTYDFTDKNTIGVILTKESYIIESRLSESTSQEWAATLIKDMYGHAWNRACRVGFANGVRLVMGDAELGEKIDYTKSPLTHWYDEAHTILIKDEAPIIDVTDYVRGAVTEEIMVPKNLHSHLHKGLSVEAMDKEAIIKALKEADFRLVESAIDVTMISGNSCVITPIGEPYMLSKEARMVFNVLPPKPKEQLSTIITKTDLLFNDGSDGNVPTKNDLGLEVEPAVLIQAVIDTNSTFTMNDGNATKIVLKEGKGTGTIVGAGKFEGEVEVTFKYLVKETPATKAQVKEVIETKEQVKEVLETKEQVKEVPATKVQVKTKKSIKK